MDRTIRLTDEQYEAMTWEGRRDGVTPEDVLARWVADAAKRAIADLNSRLSQMRGLDDASAVRVRRAVLAQPDPEVEALKLEIEALKAKLPPEDVPPAPDPAPYPLPPAEALSDAATRAGVGEPIARADV